MNELVFVIAPALFSMVCAYLSVNINKEQAPLQFLFLIATMGFMIIGTSTQVTLANVYNSTGVPQDIYNISLAPQWLSMFLMIAVVFLIFVLLLMWLFKKFDPKGKYNDLHDDEEA
jgi:cytochrome bd-type quinol oxidase subunit 2